MDVLPCHQNHTFDDFWICFCKEPPVLFCVGCLIHHLYKHGCRSSHDHKPRSQIVGWKGRYFTCQKCTRRVRKDSKDDSASSGDESDLREEMKKIRKEANRERWDRLLVPVYSLWNSIGKDHILTTSEDEVRNCVEKLGFTSEDVLCRIWSDPIPETIPLYRLFKPSIENHFYTASPSGKDNAVKCLGYHLECVLGYVYRGEQTDTIPMYRFYSPSLRDHCYTISYCKAIAMKKGLQYTAEGIVGYVRP